MTPFVICKWEMNTNRLLAALHKHVDQLLKDAQINEPAALQEAIQEWVDNPKNRFQNCRNDSVIMIIRRCYQVRTGRKPQLCLRVFYENLDGLGLNLVYAIGFADQPANEPELMNVNVTNYFKKSIIA